MLCIEVVGSRVVVRLLPTDPEASGKFRAGDSIGGDPRRVMARSHDLKFSGRPLAALDHLANATKRAERDEQRTGHAARSVAWLAASILSSASMSASVSAAIGEAFHPVVR